MIIIERKYKEWNSEYQTFEDLTERKVFTDVDYNAIQKFIDQDGVYTYTKL